MPGSYESLPENGLRPPVSLRMAAIPTDHLVAEITAIPLAFECSFTLAVCDLDPALEGTTKALWRQTEHELVRTAPSRSLDELIAFRDRIWFQRDGREPMDPVSRAFISNCRFFHGKPPKAPNQKIALHQYVREIANQNLSTAGAVARPALHDSTLSNGADTVANDARSRQAWRWLSLALPPDLLLACLWNDTDEPVEVSELTPQITRRLLDHGFAETHLHYKGASEFPIHWISVLHYLADPNLRPDAFKSPGAVFNEGRDFAGWLLRAAMARYILSAFLRFRAEPGSALGDFPAFLRGLARLRLMPSLYPGGVTLLGVALRELARARIEPGGPSFSQLRALYAWLTKVSVVGLGDHVDQARFRDPIAALWTPSQWSSAAPEMMFLAQGLKYLDCSQAADREFATLFWQLVRIRALYYRHLVQRPMTPGLQWFTRTYARITPGRRPMSQGMMIESAATSSGLNRGLASLEVRTNPEEHLSEMLEVLREADSAFLRLQSGDASSTPARMGNSVSTPAEFGFVIHFPKLRGEGFEKGLPAAHWAQSNADPAATFNWGGYRFARFFETKRRETLALAQLLLSFPQSLELVRGIDICTDELAVPAWVFAPLFRYICGAGKRASQFLSRLYGVEVPPLRLTAHAGEDFVHMLQGLRNISDVIQFLPLREGDRIGHGVALGVDASAWTRQAGRLPITLEQRMFDLAWEWAQYARRGVDFNSSRLAHIEDSITRISTLIFGRESRATPQDIADLVEDLHTESALRVVGFPTGKRPHGLQGRYERLAVYLRDPAIFVRGHQTEWVIPDEQECQALERLQASVRQRVAALGIAIEMNPSSNLLIANLGDLRNHPLWKLRSPFKDTEQNRLRVCIGSDDPLTFAAGLPREYMLLHDVLVLAGLSADVADKWLDQVRQTGMDCRFTLPRRRFKADRWQSVQGLSRTIAPILYG